ncbi:hypothetical protein BSIN_2368 [Burkholderia singularis]|uniref:Uncharacterized protein n=1 Tax=Burkholderia singularis TaxID=1503053 RepID=A0A238H1M5_9BURK|nr:hypothetical protein BSIN_2368 [Burkholderia singularis]
MRSRATAGYEFNAIVRAAQSAERPGRYARHVHVKFLC